MADNILMQLGQPITPYLEKPVTITVHPREDGGIRISSVELPGLILSGLNPSQVMLAVLPAVRALREHIEAAPSSGTGR